MDWFCWEPYPGLRPWRKIAIWFAAWLVALGVGLGGQWKLLNLVYPLAVYCLLHSRQGYWTALEENLRLGRFALRRPLQVFGRSS